MRVLVCGGRDYTDRLNVYRWLDKLFAPHNDPDGKLVNWRQLPRPDLHLISGAARGADSFATDWAMVNWVSSTEFPADWEQHGKAAGAIRNRQMLEEGKPDLVVAFPGGKGTANMIAQAKAAGVAVLEIPK